MVCDRIRPRPRRRPAGLAVLAAAALALAGCGAGTSGGHSSTGAPATTSTAPSTSTQAPSTTTTTSTTPTLPGTGRPAVTIGDRNYTEQFVLGQLYLQALKAQGFKVSINENIGPPQVTSQALKNGSLGMYPEYLNTFDQTVAGRRRDYRSVHAAYRAGQAWAQRHGLHLLTPTPFSDTYAIAVTDVYAVQHHLRTLSDLGHVESAFTIGGAAQFQAARPGLPSLADVYGVSPRAFKAIAVGSQYDDLDVDEIQAAYVNTTDGELASGDYRLLADPRRIFGIGNVVPVVTAATLDKEGPAFAATIERVDRTLTLAAMRALNNAADATNANPATIATAFLQTHGLIPVTEAQSGS